MAIYTRWGSRVQFLEARIFPVWVERQNARIKWHFTKKEPTRLTKEMREEPMWFVRARYDDDRPGHGGDAPIWGGKFGDLYGGYVADDGLKELHAKVAELNPDHAGKFEEWNRKDAPAASAFFPLANLTELSL